MVLIVYEQFFFPLLVYLFDYLFLNVGQQICQLSKADQPGTNEKEKSPGGLKASLALIDPQDRSSKKR